MTARLDKILADNCGSTRKEIREIIRRGAVSVDGTVVRTPDAHVDPDNCIITLNGEPINYQKYIYIMMNKPAGLVSATDDPKLPTVLTLLPDKYKRRGLFPAGRLDRDTEGLLLLTDDGNAAHMMLSPVRHVEKTYYVEYAGKLVPDTIQRFASGMTIDGDEQCRPATIELLETGKARIILTEGKFHQVKRMVAACGGEVTYLCRKTFGPLSLDEGSKPGDWRELYPSEIALIEEICRKTRDNIRKSTVPEKCGKNSGEIPIDKNGQNE